jgi:hypothetical protein
MIESIHSAGCALSASTWHWIKMGGLAAIGVAAVAGIAAQALAKTVDAGPDPLSETTSLANLIEQHGTVHIVYVHGIREEGPGFAKPLADMLVSKLGFTSEKNPRDTMIALPPRPQASILGDPVWSDDDWKASEPFVRHYRLHRGNHEVKIDEINYWPLLFLLKCRYLMVPEHDLAGDDKNHLALCDRSDPPYHAILRDKDREQLRTTPRGGHAARINKALKLQIMNWGLSDAVVALGPMRVYLNYAMDRAFADARDGAGPDDKFVVMSESLGSFVVLDAMDVSPVVKEVMNRTDYLYFLANQVALLELARIQGLPTKLAMPSAADGAGDPARLAEPPPAQPEATEVTVRPGPIAALQGWASSSRDRLYRPRQIIAFSDPSDILTYRMPAISGVKVVNVYDRNAPRWLGLFEDPRKAHLGHLRNKEVWKVLLRKEPPTRPAPPKP